GPAVLWSDPGDIAARDLAYGAGGKQDQPHGSMTFVEKARGGTNPKFDVRDRDGTKWRVKTGLEAKPETAAAHLLWAVGYFADEDYFLPSLEVENMPPQLAQDYGLSGTSGVVRNARLERLPKSTKKDGHWQWKNNPFNKSRQLNGLRVMMALF